MLLGPASRAAAWRQYLAAWLACVAGVTAGAALVPVEAAVSGVLQVPLSQFLGVMIGVHLVIGLCEGGLTFAVIAYLRRVRPELLGLEPADAPAAAARPGYGVVTASLLVTALLLAGVVSWFASTWPDGLEWSYREHRYGTAEQTVDNRFAGRRRGRPVAEPVVAADRLHPPRGSAGPVARRRDGRNPRPAGPTPTAGVRWPASWARSSRWASCTASLA